MSRPEDNDELEAERVAQGSLTAVSAEPAGRLRRTWEAANSPDCAAADRDPWLRKIVVDQERPQSVTLHWSDRTVSSSVASTGKGHCCVVGGGPQGTTASVAESRRDGSNATAIGSTYTITDTERTHNTWEFWNTFLGFRGMALHQHTTVTGAPLSHGCVRLPRETARRIFCGARPRGQTHVEVRGFARPDCNDPDLTREWQSDYVTATYAPLDGERPDPARVRARAEELEAFRQAYGRRLTPQELAAGRSGTILPIPRCGFAGVPPGREAARSQPSRPAAANVPSMSSTYLARSGLESTIPRLANALDRARSLAAARTAVETVGRGLWTQATAAARAGSTDDRPLYWARVQLRRTLDQWQPRFGLTAARRDDLNQLLERASRGMLAARFAGPNSTKRIVISGFDPFGFERRDYGLSEATNPSAAAALALDGRQLTSGSIKGSVESVVFPVSFRAFDERIVEQLFAAYLSGPGHADMIMTISMNAGPAYEVEEWAGRTRGAGTPDNPGVTPATAGAAPGLPAGPEFIRGTLPPSARRTLRPQKPAPTRGELEIMERVPGSSKVTPSLKGPTPGSTSVAGSGGSYLSNEIFYRVGLLATQAGSKIHFGHLHVPFLARRLPNPNQSPAAAILAQQTRLDRERVDLERQAIVRQVEAILTDVLPDL